jgi:predicted transporter
MTAGIVLLFVGLFILRGWSSNRERRFQLLLLSVGIMLCGAALYIAAMKNVTS